MEVAHYFRHLPKENFRRKLSTIQNLATLTLINLDLDIAELAFEQLIRYAKIGIGSRDSIILSTMKATGTKIIASHDEVFKKIEDLEVVDPIPWRRSRQALSNARAEKAYSHLKSHKL